MKKIILMMVFILAILPFSSAISSDIKENYSPGETLIAAISGNVLEYIAQSNVEFLRGHVKVPLDYDFKKLGDKYYLWAALPVNENNYTLRIKDISTTVNGQNQKINFEKNFSVKGNLTEYSIKPGFVFTRGDFEISIQSNLDEVKTIDTDFPTKREIVLNPGINKVEYSISSTMNTTLINITLGKYIIPLYVIKQGSNNGAFDLFYPEIRFKPQMIQSISLDSNDTHYPFIVYNTGDHTIINVSLEFEKNLFLIEPSSNFDIKPNELLYFNLSLKNKNAGDEVRGIIYLKYQNFTFELPVDIKLTDDSSQVSTPYLTDERGFYNCNEISGGKICNISSEVCKGNVTLAMDSPCCVGTCVSNKNSKAWIGYLIAGIILIVLSALILKYKRIKPEKNPLKKQIKDIEQRMEEKEFSK